MSEGKRIALELRTAGHVIKRYFDNSCTKQYADSVTGMHGWVIRYLYDNRERDIFQRDIEEKFNIRRSSVSAMVDIMEQSGLIVRAPVLSDARLKKLTLTDKAIELHNRLEEDLKMRENMLISGIDNDELEVFFHTLEKIKNNAARAEGAESTEAK